MILQVGGGCAASHLQRNAGACGPRTPKLCRSYAVGVWGRPGRPQIAFFPPVLGGYAAQNGREESFLEGLRPSKPPNCVSPAVNTCHVVTILPNWQGGASFLAYILLPH